MKELLNSPICYLVLLVVVILVLFSPRKRQSIQLIDVSSKKNALDFLLRLVQISIPNVTNAQQKEITLSGQTINGILFVKDKETYFVIMESRITLQLTLKGEVSPPVLSNELSELIFGKPTTSEF